MASPEDTTPKMASSCMNAPKIMVFRPTMEEMNDFSGYIAYMESKGAHLAGIAKIIPPKEFVPRKRYDDLDDMVIPAPIQQEVMGHQGLYTQYNIQKKAMTVGEFRKVANSTKYCTPSHFDYEDLERKYWKNITYNPPIYGADISGSIYDKGWNIWNINKLNTVLDLIEEEEGVKIEGVNTAYLYFGMWKTTFAWHTEDMDLYSINYVHHGAPKTWYAIPTEHARRLERLAAGFFPGSFADCPSFLRHKMTVIAPYILKKYSIPYDKITQERGEFIITFPYGYHAGFNHGFNVAESTNFASIRWIDFGKRATSCVCTKDSVKIEMNPFVRVFQPDRHQAWIEGRDIIYIPEVDGPNQPTVSHKPAGLENPVRVKQVHRRHPVHKKGIIGEVTRKRPRVKKEKVLPDQPKDPEKKVAKRKKDDGPEKKKLKKGETGSKQKKGENRKSMEASEKERRKLKRKLKKLKKEKGLSEIQAHPTYDLSQLAEAAERVIASQGVVIPGKTKVKTGAGDSKRKRPDSTTPTNNGSSMSNGHDTGNSGSNNIHSYSKSSGSASKRKNSKPQKRKDATVVAADYGLSGVGTSGSGEVPSDVKEVKKEPGVEDSPGKYTQRGASLIPTRTNTDGTPAAFNTGPKGSKELSKMKNNWVRSMNGLWCIQPPQFISEQVHNLSMADQKPGCCVCMLFYNDKLDIADWGDDEAAFSSSNSHIAGTSRDQRLRVLCPEMCFACSSENPTPLIENPAVDAQGRSPIINCVSCKIAVHAACYGEDAATITDDWKCSRCKDEDWQDISCCLCNLRGGALKPTTTGHWAHIVCAMAITEVSFQNVKQRSPIDVTKISPQRLKLKCYYCRSFIKCSPKYASCIQCSVGKCALSFHVTCAKAAGVMMEPSDWPYPVYATCCKHPFANKDIIRRAGLPEISTGEMVIAKHKNSRYYEAEVIGEREQMFCHVNFYDNSFSENLFPEDIESHNIQRDGPPVAGTRVKVRWTDGLLYDGAYVKDSFIKIYDVEFQDGSIVTVKREDIYSRGEDIPKRVRMKLSVASEMRHQDFYGSQVIDEKHRQVTSRYATPSPEESEDTSDVIDPDHLNVDPVTADGDQ